MARAVSWLLREDTLSVLVCRMTKTHEDEMERRQREAEDRLAAMQRAADRKLKETLAQFESTQMDEMDKMRRDFDKRLNESVTAAKNELNKKVKELEEQVQSGKERAAAIATKNSQAQAELAAMTRMYHLEKVSVISGARATGIQYPQSYRRAREN